MAAGQGLADRLCARCHVITPGGGASWTDAPAFASIANRPGVTAAKLSVFIQGPHLHMLNTNRPADQANEIAAFIMSLRQG